MSGFRALAVGGTGLRKIDLAEAVRFILFLFHSLLGRLGRVLTAGNVWPILDKAGFWGRFFVVSFPLRSGRSLSEPRKPAKNRAGVFA
jgi:hypothetical protein